MEYEKSGITRADVKGFAMSSPNSSTDTQIHSSDISAGIETGSTVGSDLTTNATSRMHSSSSSSSSAISHNIPDIIKDAEGRAIHTRTSAEEDQEGQESQASGGGCIPDLKPTTHNAYGLGIYGTDPEIATSPRKLERATIDSQNTEGLTSDVHDDTHNKDAETTSMGKQGQTL
ncbi:unnamed protein product [Sphagnum troendelagicum]|uniref:Uncharacterized protein n=1 Tax=Sphagnum troendelagicum TaxID=128251 RepID=A0ABP0UE05_9BRYO